MAAAISIKDLAKRDPKGLIGRAFAFSEAAHRKQLRKTGEPYFVHTLATAEILNRWRMDDTTIAAGLLHDTVEDTGVSLEKIRKEFGDDVAFLVDGVTKLGHIKYRGAEKKVENLRKMILALSQDLRVVFIKLADRLHNMRTLNALPPAKQKRVAMETDEIYAPLAYRLGMHDLSGELQDLAFPYLHPREYRWLLAAAKEQYDERLAYLERIRPQIEELLKKRGVKPLDIEIRAKRYSSLYKKLLKRDMDIGKVYDLVATRVIVKNIPDCYAVLGVIHEAWPPVPRRIKDYIAMPKPNAYRSLHTTVIGPEGKMIEFQIRTKAMHDENEYGVAAHWLYDQKRRGEKVTGQKLAEEITWVQQLKDWQERFFGKAKSSEEILKAMKIDFFQDRIFAVTPRGDVMDLPAGATPVDFAYHIHSAIGDSCTGARVNGALVPLDHKLRSGDVVEILVQKGKKPSEDWLRFVKTGVARDHIRNALRGKDQFARIAKKPTRCEIRLTVERNIDLIKDISSKIADRRLKIISFHAENPKGGNFRFDRIEVQCADRSTIDKLVVNLRKIPGVKAVSYKLL